MRILVTGGSGFIGSHLCDLLLRKEHEVVVVDNLITGDIQNVAHLAGRDDFSFVKYDVSNFIFIPGKVNAVMHLASPARMKRPDRLSSPYMNRGSVTPPSALQSCVTDHTRAVGCVHPD